MEIRPKLPTTQLAQNNVKRLRRNYSFENQFI